MRRVFAFMGCLLRFWTWEDLLLGWVKTLLFRPVKVESTSAGHLPSVKGQEESEFARFLSSLPEDDRWCKDVSLEHSRLILRFGPHQKEFCYEGGFGGDMGASYFEFLAAVASSKTMYRQRVFIFLCVDDEMEHVVEIVQALRQSGNDFQELYLSSTRGSAIQYGKCVASVLRVCDGIESLSINFMNAKKEVMGKEVVAEFMANVTTPNSLQILRAFSMDVNGLDGEGVEEVTKPFMDPSSVLKELTLSGITSSVKLEHVSAMLATSTSFIFLFLFNVTNGEKRGYASLGPALLSNQSLVILYCNIFGIEDLKALLDPLMPKRSNDKHNTTLTSLSLEGDIGRQEGVEFLAKMLHKNTSLLYLSFNRCDDLQTNYPHALENVLAILEALKGNTSLKSVSFFNCIAIGGSKVLGSMMDLLSYNHCIEDIHLFGTPLKESGDAQYVNSALSKKNKLRLWKVVQGMANARPTSGRIFLCGEPYAELQAKHKGRKKERTWIQNLFKHQAKSKEKKNDVVLQCTRGIEVASIQFDGIGITIWDVAGQTDYHSFHELVMPSLSADGSCSLFMFLCNPMERSSLSSRRNPSKIKAEIETWLRLIASNSRRSLSYCPHVCIVMTHFDYWEHDNEFGKCIVDVVEELKSQFEEVLEFDDDNVVFKVNGTKELDAKKVCDFMRCHMKHLLERLPPTISACNEVQGCIAKWNVESQEQLLLEWDEFCKHVCKGVEGLEDGDVDLAKWKREFVAISLNDGGHIIYNEEGDTVITNPHWFCHNIMGEFLHQYANNELAMVLHNGLLLPL